MWRGVTDVVQRPTVGDGTHHTPRDWQVVVGQRVEPGLRRMETGEMGVQRGTGVANQRDVLLAALEMVERWVPPVSSQVRKRLTEWVTGSGGLTSLHFMVDLYADMMRPHAQELGYCGSESEAADVLGAGLFCWYGQLLFYVSQYGDWSDNSRLPEGVLYGDELLSATFDFVLLYVNFDYFLDRCGDSGRKLEVLVRLRLLLERPEMEMEIPGFAGLVAAYRRLVKRRPELRRRLLDLYNYEVRASLLQRGGGLSRDQYLEMARGKGGLTSLAIQTLITGSTTDESDAYEVGSIVQLLDDMMDVREDLRDGIHTVATHELQESGNIDALFCYTVARIDGLTARFTLFKPFMMGILTYVLSQPLRYSSTLQRLLAKSIYIDWKRGAHMLPIINMWVSARITRNGRTEVGEDAPAAEVPTH